mgnify:CR=1 FL=1
MACLPTPTHMPPPLYPPSAAASCQGGPSAGNSAATGIHTIYDVKADMANNLKGSMWWQLRNAKDTTFAAAKIARVSLRIFGGATCLAC